MEQMNEGVKILIDRMQTNPEDFAVYGGLRISGSHSWRNLAEAVIDDKVMFTDEEKSAISVALREVTRKNFTAKILEMLAGPRMDEEMMQRYAKNMIITDSAANMLTGIQPISSQAAMNAWTEK